MIYDKARELSRMLAESEEYKAYKGFLKDQKAAKKA